MHRIFGIRSAANEETDVPREVEFPPRVEDSKSSEESPEESEIRDSLAATARKGDPLIRALVTPR